jgi:multidrug efflux pump subunit AcrB
MDLICRGVEWLSGNLKQNIYVTVDPLKANEYNISPILLSQSIKQATASYPAGNIKSNNSTISLSIDPFVQTVDDIRNITLSIQEKAVRLEDIATVQESSATDQART